MAVCTAVHPLHEGDVHRFHHCAKLFEDVYGLRHYVPGLRPHLVAHHLLDYADPQALDVAAEVRGVVGHGVAACGRVLRVVPGDGLEHDSRVLGRSAPGGRRYPNSQDRVKIPWRLSRLQLGRSPAIPFTDPGPRMEPPVSPPIVPLRSPAATEDPDPADDPAGLRSSRQGLRGASLLKNSSVPPMWNS